MLIDINHTINLLCKTQSIFCMTYDMLCSSEDSLQASYDNFVFVKSIAKSIRRYSKSRELDYFIAKCTQYVDTCRYDSH